MKAKATFLSAARLNVILLATAIVALACAGCGQHASQPTQAPPAIVSFKPQEMADALHAVIAADREVYAFQVMKLGRGKDTAVSSQQIQTGLPLPAHVLRMGSEVVQKNGAEFHYVLRSLSPINPRNAPETEIERTGLKFVAQHPNSNYYAEESLGGRRYLTAVYPDLVISTACGECHKQQGQRPQRAYEVGEVIGGIIVRVPLEF